MGNLWNQFSLEPILLCMHYPSSWGVLGFAFSIFWNSIFHKIYRTFVHEKLARYLRQIIPRTPKLPAQEQTSPPYVWFMSEGYTRSLHMKGRWRKEEGLVLPFVSLTLAIKYAQNAGKEAIVSLDPGVCPSMPTHQSHRSLFWTHCLERSPEEMLVPELPLHLRSWFVWSTLKAQRLEGVNSCPDSKTVRLANPPGRSKVLIVVSFKHSSNHIGKHLQ